MNNLKRFESFFIFFGSLALFLYGMFGRELVGFETRFALFAKEMLNAGPNFFPTTYGLPYPDYPAGLTLLNTLCALPFGQLTTLAAIFPSALASSLTLVLIYYIAFPINREWGRIAVLLTLFTYEFFDAARMLSMDPLIMLACTWAFYVRFKSSTSAHHFFWLALPLIFGFLIRGPIGFILPAAVIISYDLAQKNLKSIWHFGIQALVLLTVLMALLLIAAEMQGGIHFVHDVLVMQILGRIHDHRPHDLFAYFTQSFINYSVSFELAIVSVVLQKISSPAKQGSLLPCKDDSLVKSLILWVLIILIGMSIPSVRKIRYIMPIVPALALLGARLWIEALEQKAARIVVNIFHGICLALPFVFILLTIAAILVVHLKNLDPHAHYFSAFCTLGLFALASIYILFHHPIEYGIRNPKKVIGIGLASFCAIIIFVIQPIEISLNRVKPFVTNVINAKAPNDLIVFFQVDRDAEPIQFMSGLPEPLNVSFVDQIDFQNPNILYITKVETFDALPDHIKHELNIVLKGKLGHKEMVVFKENS